MTVGEQLRKQNKHRKIVVRLAATGSEVFTVQRVVNTTDPLPRSRVTKGELENFISRGFTVEIVASK